MYEKLFNCIQWIQLPKLPVPKNLGSSSFSIFWISWKIIQKALIGIFQFYLLTSCVISFAKILGRQKFSRIESFT